jgi:hypothetical protein
MLPLLQSLPLFRLSHSDLALVDDGIFYDKESAEILLDRGLSREISEEIQRTFPGSKTA